jgi:primosomal protein N' (replication factor Y)
MDFSYNFCMFAEVLLSKTSRDIDKIYHYSIPEILKDKIKIGHQVLVPFGRRSDIGYVVGFVEKADVAKVKDILEIISERPLFSEQAVALAKWIAEYYYSFFISALRLMMPPGVRSQERRKERGVRSKEKIKEVGNNLLTPDSLPLTPHFELTREQTAALKAIKQAIDDNKPQKFLLYGITGSGKTEIYMQASAYLLQKGKSSIILVPEIALTPQLVQRFRDRFQDHIAVIHSELTEKVRKEEWGRISSGQARIVLGTRSAIFAPLSDPGMIVLDEEYETTYKSDKSPRYHAREVAIKLAELNNAVVVLGSATPAVETYYKTETGEYQKLVLPSRIEDRPLPPVELIDMRSEKEFLLSIKLREELREVLSRGEQAILFINRRGFFTFAMCKGCGYTISCPTCSVSLSYHTGRGKLVCNHCGFSSEAPMVCPRCNSSSIKYFGIGTQRIEKEVMDAYPEARILRYDRDTVGKRGSHDAFFANFASGKANVMIGTQMVTKGLDVAKVTLVGVVSADTGLYLPDFRSAEHTFQLLTQVAGRAGRHHLPGKVIIQTYTPDNYVIQAAARHDYEEFYRREIEYRRELGYPPFSRLISLMISGREENEVIKIAEVLGKFLVKRLPEGVLGPAPAAISKLRGEWRYHILIKGKELENMRAAAAEVLAAAVIPADVRVTVDVDPMSML